MADSTKLSGKERFIVRSGEASVYLEIRLPKDGIRPYGVRRL